MSGKGGHLFPSTCVDSIRLKVWRFDSHLQINHFDRIAGRELHELGRGGSGDMKLIPQHIQSVVAKIYGITCRHPGGRQMASHDRQAPPYSMYNCQSRADRGAMHTSVPSTLYRLISPWPARWQHIVDETRGYATYFTILNHRYPKFLLPKFQVFHH